MIRVFQVKCATEDKKEMEAQLLKKLHMPTKDLLSWSIHRKSVDARSQKIFFSYVIDAKVKHERKYLRHKDVQPRPNEHYQPVSSGYHPLIDRPVVVGFGPAGMFAALILAQAGYHPMILERGSQVDTRTQKVHQFWQTGQLDPECNVQFGEGGAGTFSDGKLTTRSKDSRCRKVLEELVRFGARSEILIDQHPHIGTDAFVQIIKNCRNEIERLGGTFCFDTALEDIQVKDGNLVAIQYHNVWHPCTAMILACGHSAKDTLLMLHAHHIQLENKRFAIGVRIEHRQDYINQAMLKEYAHDPRLIPARYKLTYTASNQKGVYTFCMCPGGYVIPAASEAKHTVINGMSYAKRDGTNANSALLVQVDESDYGKAILGGLAYQEELEAKAYQMAHGYAACCQLASDYLDHKISTAFGAVQPTYALGTQFVDLNTLFSNPINQALHEALENFEQRVPGFVSSGAILSAVESRSSSAIRISRDPQGMSSIFGLYPSGEGSGYAGGIVTSAIDGIHSAEKLIEYFEKPQYNLEKEGCE
ncbi:MAG: hypothetical protein SOS22_05195 [Absicoccus sp.]|uniref:NAD(P)/FAD-dependent oxidoreductase n=1 Tax=Absicoccus sp. TaxID=2718527 RepID=UPI002A760FFA|nr:hypothetical protein [Absicoccus sp.]MDY3035595.1 hypothetical protein [Absicoccus sp.]